MIPFAGNFHITGIEESRKTGHGVTVFSGDFGLGVQVLISAITSPEFKYSVTGSLDNTTKVLTFEGERSMS